jgi:uncharacterized membrane protein YhaH (DUF805 family)
LASGDGIGNWRLLLRTLRRTFDFTGRSRRTEVASYWVAVLVVTGIAEGAATSLFSEQAGRLVRLGLTILFMLPWFALFARRLHDHDMSGWWALLLVALFAIAVPKMLAEAFPDPRIGMVYRPSGLRTAIGFILILALLGLTLAPERIGPNRFGADPREGE